MRAELSRREDALLQEGFHFTAGRSFPSRAAQPLRVELLLPPSSDEREVRLWAEAREGVVSLRLIGPDGGQLAFATGRSAEVRLVRALSTGSYQVELDSSRAEAGQALIGVKGPVLGSCTLNAQVVEHPADPARGFHWPYLLYTPPGPRAGALLVAPNNTGFATVDPTFLRASAACQLKGELEASGPLAAPILVPLFPRPEAAAPEENLYLHALTRASLEATAPPLRRVDLQLVAMIDDAREQLAAGGAVSPRVLLTGFSAAGSFVQRFALLHPERVLAVASGSPGGWPTAPLAALDGEPLPWPVGVGDLESLAGAPLNRKALAQVRWLFFLGDQDENDAVPYRDSFSKEDEALISRRFGATPLARWPKAEQLYRAAGLSPTFRIYPGVAHATTREMKQDVVKFFREAMAGG